MTQVLSDSPAKKHQKRASIVSFWAAFSVSCILSGASQAASWDKADACYASEDYVCAFNEGISLLKMGKIVVGPDDRTTDSMTFLQMAYVEAASTADAVVLSDMATKVVKEIPKRSPRLPYLFGFALLSVKDICDDVECAGGYDAVFCKANSELPPVSWRQLDGIEPLSSNGTVYFERVAALTPNCAGDSQ